MSMREQFIKVLESIGWHRDEKSTSLKYDVFTNGREPFKYYVGRSGALRKGASIRASIPVSNGAKSKLLEIAKSL